MNNVQLIAQAVDSFIFSYFATIPELYNQVVEARFKTNEKKYTSYELEILNRKFKVQQKIGRSWPIFMKSEDNVEIKLRITHPKEKAGMEIQIPKNILWNGDPFPEVEKIVQLVVQNFGEGDFCPTRIDLCRIYQMPKELILDEGERALFTGYWREFHNFYSSRGKRADQITGFRFGSFRTQTVYFKVYLKSLELEENEKSFDITKYFSSEISSESDIISFEVTYESQFLRGRQITSIETLKSSLAGLWEYATQTYIVQRDGNYTNKEVRKRPLSDLWKKVSSPWSNEHYSRLIDKELSDSKRLSNTLKKKKKLQKLYKDIYGDETPLDSDYQKLLKDSELKRGKK
jgi:hypothetical protein